MLSISEAIKLHKKKGRNDHGLFLVEGKKIVEEVLKSGWQIQQLFLTEKFQTLQSAFIETHHLTSVPTVTASDSNIARLSSTETPSGIVAVVRLPKQPEIKGSKIVAFENIKDPTNLGTMIRTADWFGCDLILTSSTGVDPFNDKVIRASMGSLFHVPVVSVLNLIEILKQLKQQGVILITSRPEATSTLTYSPNRYCLIVGNESNGTSPEVDTLATQTLSVPGSGNAESLNVSVSFGIMLYQLKFHEIPSRITPRIANR